MKVLLLGVLLLLGQCQHTPLPIVEDNPKPERLLILVFDQMRPDYVDRFSLKHFRSLTDHGLSFTNAVVGHLFSLTVVSHPVITLGLFPKNFPIFDDIFPDMKGSLGKKGAFYDATSLKADEFSKLFSKDFAQKTSLLAALKEKRAGKTYAVAQKSYAAYGMGVGVADSIITLGPIRKEAPLRGWREPIGYNVPPSITQPQGGRFYLEGTSSFGSESTLYPLDGTRFVPGGDKEHLGGDRWVADVILNIMDTDRNWTAIAASFGSIDRISHMLAEQESPTVESWAKTQGFDLKSVLRRADEELGRIIDALNHYGLLNKTVIIVTADHGGQFNSSFHGLVQPKRHGDNWIYGEGPNFKRFSPSPVLDKILNRNVVKASVHDTALRFWLHSTDRTAISQFVSKVKALPGVAEIYTKYSFDKGIQYVRSFRTREFPPAQLHWANAQHAKLLESQASPGSADVVALLLDNHGYGTLGDHGGAQEKVQRIPLYMVAPQLRSRAGRVDASIRLVDINPITRKLFNLPLPTELDGTSAPISPYLSSDSR